MNLMFGFERIFCANFSKSFIISNIEDKTDCIFSIPRHATKPIFNDKTTYLTLFSSLLFTIVTSCSTIDVFPTPASPNNKAIGVCGRSSTLNNLSIYSSLPKTLFLLFSNISNA